MTIVELGALGELIGAVAVVGSLLYLAQQIRHSASANSVSTLRELQRDFREAIGPRTEEQRQAVVKDLRGDSLTRAEDMLIIRLVESTMRVFESIWYAHRKGLLAEDMLRGYLTQAVRILNPPRNRERWDLFAKKAFHPDFVSYIEEFVDSNPIEIPNFEWLAESDTS